MKKLGYLSVTEKDKKMHVAESFKGEVANDVIKFPQELGAKHPFEFKDAENVIKTLGIISGGINKIADNIVGEFSVKTDDLNAKKLIDDFIKESDLQLHIRTWITEGLSKGNGFLEIDIKEKKVRVLNANDMYVVRDKNGEIKGYNQFTGHLNKFVINSRKLTPFDVEEIAHLKINKIAGEPYGQGMLMPNERIIDHMMAIEDDLHKLIARKAGVPYHIKVGNKGEVTDPSAIDAIKNLLVYMTNRTEWVTDANVEIIPLQLGEVGKNLIETLQHDLRMLCAGMEIPEVLFGSGQLNEGIAKVQQEQFQRKIASIQEDIEYLIENKILRPILLDNSMDVDIEFVWNLPGEEEINLRLTQLNMLLQNQFLSDGMRNQIQIEIGRLLNFADVEDLVNTGNTQGQTADKTPTFDPTGKLFQPGQKKEASNDAQKKKEGNIKQPEVPGAKNVKQGGHIHLKESGDMTIKEWTNLQEVAGFNYSDYLINILKVLKTDKFEDLKAITEADIQNGLLNDDQVEKLRQILKDGFRKNKTIVQIEKDVGDNLGLTDRITEDGKTIPADARPSQITRTETVRIANEGLLDTYSEAGIERVRWLSSYGERTCDECAGHNGEVFSIDESYGMIPLHPMCRCSWLSIKE